jgi:hypothetical protein
MYMHTIFAMLYIRLPVRFTPVGDPVNAYYSLVIVYSIENAIVPFSDPPPFALSTFEFYHSTRPRVLR